MLMLFYVNEKQQTAQLNFNVELTTQQFDAVVRELLYLVKRKYDTQLPSSSRFEQQPVLLFFQTNATKNRRVKSYHSKVSRDINMGLFA